MNYLILGTGRFSEEDYKNALTDGTIRFWKKPESVQDVISAIAGGCTPDYLLIDLTNNFSLNLKHLAKVLGKSPSLITCVVAEKPRLVQVVTEFYHGGYSNIFYLDPYDIQNPKHVLDSFNTVQKSLRGMKPAVFILFFIIMLSVAFFMCLVLKFVVLKY